MSRPIISNYADLAQYMNDMLTFRKENDPHFSVLRMTKSTGRTSLFYIDSSGKLTQHELPSTTWSDVKESFLDNEAEELTVLYNVKNSEHVSKLRITDNLTVIDEEVEVQGDIKLGKDTLFINRKSPLGYLESLDLADMSARKLTGFNFNYFLAHPK